MFLKFYYKKLVQHKKLIKFWVFFGQNIRSTFKVNYQFLNVFYSRGCFINIRTLLSCVKKIFPLFINISKNSSNLLFVSTNFLYSQTIYNKHYFHIIKEFLNKKLGVFTNFSIIGYNYFRKLDFKYNPCFIIFLDAQHDTSLLIESKKKNIPTIALTNTNLNSFLVDYPLCINSPHFYTIYFLSKFLFKLILLNKYEIY